MRTDGVKMTAAKRTIVYRHLSLKTQDSPDVKNHSYVSAGRNDQTHDVGVLDKRSLDSKHCQHRVIIWEIAENKRKDKEFIPMVY